MEEREFILPDPTPISQSCTDQKVVRAQEQDRKLAPLGPHHSSIAGPNWESEERMLRLSLPIARARKERGEKRERERESQDWNN